MKKILLSIILICTTILVSAINVTTNLNPFAYNLSAELSADQTTLTVKYCLNANVESLKVVIKNGESDVYTHTCSGEFLKKTTADKPYFSPYQLSIPVSQLGAGTYTWRIEVTGEGRNEVQVYSQDGKTAYTYSLYLPSSVDIVKDPTSFNYGKVIVVEGSHSGKGNSNYASKDIGAGLYVFNPDFTPILNRNDKQGFNGGSKTWGDETNSYFANTTYAPRRVRVSEDGRIFVASMYKHSGTKHTYIHGDILWEVDPYFSKWTTVMGAGVGGATYDITPITGGYYQNQLETSGGSFIAAPCAGLDVRGKGENLKLLLLSCDYRAFANNYQGFHLCEYNLRTASTWATIPSKEFNVTTENAITNPTKRLFAAPTNSNVQYDKDGGVWCVSFRATASAEQPALVHKNADKSEDYRNTERDNTKNAGFRFNNDFTKVIIATTGKIGTVYDYTTKANGYFTNGTAIDMSAVGEYLNDFAWDNANNIYAVGNNGGVKQDNTTGGHVAVYCLPYSNSDVFTTPGPSGFTINCREGLKYTVTTTVNDAAMGGATGGGKIQSCTNVALTATPNTNYRFVNWTIGGKVVSTANPYTFMVTDDITVTANFAPSVFNVTWHNLLKSTTDPSNIDVDTNQELWELLMPMFNDYVYQLIKSGKDNCNENDQYYPSAYYRGTQTIANVCTFFETTYGQAHIIEFMTDPSSIYAFKWLGDYILSVCGTSSLSQQNWAVNIAAFFNCNTSSQKWNSVTYTSSNFSTAGQPSQWLPYYREYVCGLKAIMNYEDEMPTDFYYLNYTGNGKYNSSRPAIPTWYVSNDAVANPNKLLAWRLNGTDGKIIHKVDDDMALYATWVNKHIQENDPNDEASNYDVITLMKNHTDATHNITVTRKLQGGMYNTISFPFAMDETQLRAYKLLLNEAEVKSFSSVTTTTEEMDGESVTVLNFVDATTIEAGKPYLIKPQSDETDPVTIFDIQRSTLTLDAKSDAINGFTFHAVLNPTEIPEGSIILVANNRLALTTEEGRMEGLRGYFTINPAVADVADVQEKARTGRIYLSMNAPTTTSVPLAPEAEKQEAPKAQKILRNGKIYILRDGKTYSITGARVE